MRWARYPEQNYCPLQEIGRAIFQRKVTIAREYLKFGFYDFLKLCIENYVYIFFA